MVVVSSTQAKARFSELVKKTTEGDEVIIQRRGQPVAVMLSFQEFRAFQALRDQKKREDALARLRALAQEVREQNRDLTPAEQDALAADIARDAVVGLVARGEVRFDAP